LKEKRERENCQILKKKKRVVVEDDFSNQNN
jgi:hypothetical protein